MASKGQVGDAGALLPPVATGPPHPDMVIHANPLISTCFHRKCARQSRQALEAYALLMAADITAAADAALAEAESAAAAGFRDAAARRAAAAGELAAGAARQRQEVSERVGGRWRHS
jgi:hypothetical protein